jgi:[ribosomal protein S5]-alanine N-acetyltransferase
MGRYFFYVEVCLNISPVFDYSTFPILTTERLVLRELRLADAADLLVFRGDAYVQRFNAQPLVSVAEAEMEIRKTHAVYSANEELGWGIALKDSDKIVGGIGLYHWSRYHRHAEVGYDLARNFWGQGYASEALRAVLHFGFTEMNLHRIYAGTIADNHESVRLLERNGFTREGTRRESSWEDDGTYHDSALYGLLRREFFS